jgi:hypothetical protein
MSSLVIGRQVNGLLAGSSSEAFPGHGDYNVKQDFKSRLVRKGFDDVEIPEIHYEVGLTYFITATLIFTTSFSFHKSLINVQNCVYSVRT